MTSPEPESKPPVGRRIEALVLIPNLLLVAVVVLYLIATQAGNRHVEPLVKGEKTTTVRIKALEQQLARQPGNVDSAIELARLYQRVGEFPWSYDALLAAERRGSKEPRWRLMLGLAYLELGKNGDGLRVLTAALERCNRPSPEAAGAGADTPPSSPPGGACDANTTTKLEIFIRLAQTFEKRGIDSRKHLQAAEKALHEILKPVEVDPDKMRPKAPVPPAKPTKPVRPKT